MTLFAFLTLAAAVVLLATPTSAAEPPLMIRVDAGRVVRAHADKFLGVNLNYLRDADANRPAARPLTTALSDLGVRWLRYPGGEKSDFHLWSSPPYKKSRPESLGWYKDVPGARLDFDAFIAVARRVGAEPYVVVGYDTQARTGRTKAQWLENAVSWVRYANKTKKYGVKYWEIGNENWHNGTSKPEEMAAIVTEFSRAMKAVDPTIQIGASGNTANWWNAFLPVAAPALDFVTLSLYNTWEWKSYEFWTQNPKTDLIADARSALTAAEKYHLKLVVAETNSKDYSDGGWPGDNTLGHALVTFDTLGRLMAQPEILTAMVWTTRWVKDDEAVESQWYALGPKNEILPTGRALSLWGQFIQTDLIETSGSNGLVSAFASASKDKKSLTLWLLNRGTAAQNVQIAVQSPVAYRRAVVHRLSGNGPNDRQPIWKVLSNISVSQDALGPISCPGISVTVISLQ